MSIAKQIQDPLYQKSALSADKYFAKGEYLYAAEVYKKLYKTTSRSEFLYAQAQCQRMLGQIEEAISLFAKYNKEGTTFAAESKEALQELE